MKMILVSAVLGFSSLSMAAPATCPSDMQTIRTCKSAPVAGDSELASKVFDTLAICARDKKAFMVVETKGLTDIMPAKSSIRAGGSSFTLVADDTEFTVSYATGISPVAPKNAKLSITFLKASPVVTSSSTFSCK